MISGNYYADLLREREKRNMMALPKAPVIPQQGLMGGQQGLMGNAPSQISGTPVQPPNQLASMADYIRMGQEPKVEAAQYESAKSYADALRGTEMPTGKRVGPSQIYVENPYEQASAGLKRLVGARLNTIADEKEGSVLKDALQKQAEAAGAVAYGEAAQEQQNKDRAFTQQDLEMMMTTQTALDQREFDALQAELKRKHEIQLQGVKAAEERRQIGMRHLNELNQIAQRHQNDIDGGWKTESFFDDDNKVVTLSINKDGTARYGTSQGEEVPSEELRKLIPYYASTDDGSMPQAISAANRKLTNERFADADSAMNEINNLGDRIQQITLNPKLAEYAGRMNVPRIVSKYGLLGDQSWEAQSLDQKIRYLVMQDLADYAEIFRPMSEAETKIAMESLASLDLNQPMAIIDFFNTRGRDHIRDAYQKGMRSLDSPEAKENMRRSYDQALNRIDEAVYGGMIVNGGITPDNFKDVKPYGYDEDLFNFYYNIYKEAQ